MRMGVLDVGSNTVHMLIVDAYFGARPLPAYSHKSDLRLVELLDDDGNITKKGADQLVKECVESVAVAEDKGAQTMLGFATSALREARNGEEVIRRVHDEAGIELTVLSGEDEARLTFLAVRRWYGWSSGRLLCIDIGGGSLEIAQGVDESPDVAISLPLGAARLNRDWFHEDPPSKQVIRELRKHVRAEVASIVGHISRFGEPDQVVVSSKTFRSLARVAGAAPYGAGQYVRRTLARDRLPVLADQLASMSASDRAQLPGVSASRADQLLAGAIVADAAFDLFEVEVADVCPWALREGMILNRLDRLAFEQTD